MTVPEARRAMKESFRYFKYDIAVREIKFRRDEVSYVYDSTLGWGNGRKGSVKFTDAKKISTEQVKSTVNHVQYGETSLWFDTEAHARMFIDAALILKAAALGPEPEPADYAAFVAAAQLWRQTNPRPEMPDDARADKAMAQNAIQRKDFAAALAAYGEALEKYPLWPEGQYNAATLAAEAADYELAAYHMHRYLALAPDAPDASNAKDKFLLWQKKAQTIAH